MTPRKPGEGRSVNLWLPDALYNDLATLARHDGRGIPGTARFLLQKALAAYDLERYRRRQTKREGSGECDAS